MLKNIKKGSGNKNEKNIRSCVSCCLDYGSRLRDPSAKALEEAVKDLEKIYEDIGIDLDSISDDADDFSIWGETQPIPESWLQYPDSEILYYMPNAYEIDFRNMKVTAQSWSLLAPADVPSGREGWLKVVEYYDGLAEKRDDFSKGDSEGFYKWGEYEVRLDGDTSQDDDNRFEIWFGIELIEPIDPSEPIQ